MPKWKFWEQPAEPTRPAKPVSDTPAPRTARAGSGLGPPEAPRLPRPSLPMAVDPERRTAAKRRQEGIPVGPGLLAKVRDVAAASGAAWIMDG